MINHLISFVPEGNITYKDMVKLSRELLGFDIDDNSVEKHLDLDENAVASDELYNALDKHGIKLMLRDTEWSINIDHVSGGCEATFVFSPSIAHANSVLSAMRSQLVANGIAYDKNFGKDVDGAYRGDVDEMKEVFEEYLEEVANTLFADGQKKIVVIENWSESLGLKSSLCIYKIYY